ncbi:MAG: hypothetical protein HRU40_06835 [Saprospiraceae bacterium]|nr:hypothetical protein [Saprospiraceae bacterium]
MYIILAINWACLWPLLVAAILPFLLGYLFRHLAGGGNRDQEKLLKDENKRLREQLTTLETDDASLKYQLEEADKKIIALKEQSVKAEAEIAGLRERMVAMNTPEHKQVAEKHLLATGSLEDHTEEELRVLRTQEYSAVLSPDNLQVIEGIGPKIEAMLKAKSIPNWMRLAETSLGELKAHLGAEKLSMHDPTTWPDQAALARDAKWNELADLQRKLDGGKLNSGDGDTPVKIDRIAFDQSVADVGKGRAVSTLDYGNLFAANDFQVIEGIGPKVNQILNENGITSWEKLASMEVAELRELLAEKKLKMMNPDSWPQQAALASAGKWDELIALQKQLDGGKSSDKGAATAAKLETLALKKLGFNQDPNDLKIIEGIGPKIEKLLKAAGIITWSDLSEASVESLQTILTDSGSRFRLAQPNTWPKQAKLAMNADWDALKKYQDELQGGRE